jgi:muramoyltetrapeptide carboxypeptidase
MLSRVIPSKLRPGDTVQVVAPSSLFMLPADMELTIRRRIQDELGLHLTFSVGSSLVPDALGSTSIQARVDDLHRAFSDPQIQGIFTFIGGYNSNELLPYLDWELFRRFPKVLCGYSDITALSHAMWARSGLVTYSGPHYSTFAQELEFDYVLNGFRQCVMQDEPFEVLQPDTWSDDAWYEDQSRRDLLPHAGWHIHREGSATGTIIGGNLCTLNLLQGTPYLPSLEGTILFLEDDAESQPHTFNRDLESLTQLPQFSGVLGLVIGRFQKVTGMTVDLLHEIVSRKAALANIPVISNVDFGHTDPKFTFPIGGTVRLEAERGRARLWIVEH